MEQKRCSFVQKNDLFKGEFHPLHLRSDQVKWISAFGRCDSPCVASLCYEKDAYHSNKKKFFVVVHLGHHPDVWLRNKEVPVDTKDSPRDEEIVLLSSNEFHHTYGIGQGCFSLVVGTVSTFPLSRVILSARTDETFHWANSSAFERGLMVVGTSQKSLLARQGDQFLASPRKIFGEDCPQTLHHFQNLIVYECYPVKQGYIHANTEVIIIEDTHKNHALPSSPTDTDNGDIKLKLTTREVLTLRFNKCVFDPQSDAVCTPALARKLGLEDGNIISLKLRFDPFRGDCDSVMFDDEIGLEHEEEYFSTEVSQQVAVESESQIAKDTPTLETVRLCHLRVGHPGQSNVLSEDCYKLDENAIYVSSLMCFNANNFHQLPFTIENAGVKVDKCAEDDVPYAKEIHLSLVLSPHYLPNAQFDQTLMKHLSKTRILKKNDILSIETEGNVEFLCESDENDASCEVLYYKVMKFSKEDEDSAHSHFRVNLKHTALYQLGTTNSFVPAFVLTPAVNQEPAGLRSTFEDLKKILTPFINGELDMSAATVLLSGAPGSGKTSITAFLSSALNLHLVPINCHELTSDSSGATEAKISSAFQRAAVYAPCIAVLEGIECLGKDADTGQTDHRVCTALRNAVKSLVNEEYPVVVIAVTSSSKAVVSKIRSLFLHQFEIKSLSEIDRRKSLQQLLDFVPTGNDIDVQWIAKQTVGFTSGELQALVQHAVANARERVAKECAVGNTLSWMDEINVCAAGIKNQHSDFIQALHRMQSQRADIIGVPKIPDVKWDDIGGLEEVKNTIKDTIQLPLEHPELVSAGLRRSGILLYGPPGTGKTLLAKAVATQCSLSFLSVKGPELINMYVGQSEENVRKVFSRARDAAPCVVFFDELDSLAPNRGRSGDSGGVMDRVVSQLLAELDGLVQGDVEKQIFVIGASNRPDLIDPALLRPGRFDKLLYVGINTNKIDQLKILEAQTRRANLSPNVRLDEIVESCPDNMTGADFCALTSEAMMNAIRRRIEIEEARGRGPEKQDEQAPLVVEQEDFEKAAVNIVPSVSEKELARFQNIKSQLTTR